MTLTREHFRGETDRFGKVASDFRQRCQKEISKAVSAKLAVATKAMTKETRQQRRVFRERDHAVADVARRQHLQFVAQASGTATVVGNSNDGRQTLDPDLLFGLSNQS